MFCKYCKRKRDILKKRVLFEVCKVFNFKTFCVEPDFEPKEPYKISAPAPLKKKAGSATLRSAHKS